MKKWTLKLTKITGARYALNNETQEKVTEADSPEQYAKIRKSVIAAVNRKTKDDLLSSFGLVKVRGAVSGKTYWE